MPAEVAASLRLSVIRTHLNPFYRTFLMKRCRAPWHVCVAARLQTSSTPPPILPRFLQMCGTHSWAAEGAAASISQMSGDEDCGLSSNEGGESSRQRATNESHVVSSMKRIAQMNTAELTTAQLTRAQATTVPALGSLSAAASAPLSCSPPLPRCRDVSRASCSHLGCKRENEGIERCCSSA